MRAFQRPSEAIVPGGSTGSPSGSTTSVPATAAASAARRIHGRSSPVTAATAPAA